MIPRAAIRAHPMTERLIRGLERTASGKQDDPAPSLPVRSAPASGRPSRLRRFIHAKPRAQRGSRLHRGRGVTLVVCSRGPRPPVAEGRPGPTRVLPSRSSPLPDAMIGIARGSIWA